MIYRQDKCHVPPPLRKYLYARNDTKANAVAPTPANIQKDPMLSAFGPQRWLKYKILHIRNFSDGLDLGFLWYTTGNPQFTPM